MKQRYRIMAIPFAYYNFDIHESRNFKREFGASPGGWNCVFEHSYDEISAAAKQARKQTLVLLLANEGYLQSEI